MLQSQRSAAKPTSEFQKRDHKGSCLKVTLPLAALTEPNAR